MSYFSGSTVTMYSNYISSFLDSKIAVLNDKLYVKEHDEEKKQILELVSSDDPVVVVKEENPMLTPIERQNIHDELAKLETYKTLDVDEAHQKLCDDYTTLIAELSKEHEELNKKSKSIGKVSQTKDAKLKKLKLDYHKVVNNIFDDEGKGNCDNKASKKLATWKTEIDTLSKEVIEANREAAQKDSKRIRNLCQKSKRPEITNSSFRN